MTFIGFLILLLSILMCGIIHVVADLDIFKDRVGSLSKESQDFFPELLEDATARAEKLSGVMFKYAILLLMLVLSFIYQDNGMGMFSMGILVAVSVGLAKQFYVALLSVYRIHFTTIRRTDTPEEIE